MLSKLALSLTPSPTLTLDARVKEMQSTGISVVNLGVGEPDFDTPVFIQKSAVSAMRNGFTHYAPISGFNDLKFAIADKFYKDNKIKYDPSQIIIGLGSKPLIYLAFLTLINRGDEILIPIPSWNTFTEQAKLCGGKPVFVQLSPPFKLKAKDIEAKITKKTKILLINSPSNPTGIIIEESELKKIAKLAIKHHFYIISDEIYEKLIYKGIHTSIASLGEDIKDQTITINGLSKAYAMTGWRIGYAGGPNSLISAMIGFQSQTASSAVTFIQKAGITALRDGNKSIYSMFREFKKRRKFILSELSEIEGISSLAPEGAFYVFVSIDNLIGKKYKTSSDWCEALLEKEKIAVVPGEAFFYPGYFRLSYASSMDNLKEGIKRIKRFIDN